MAVKKRTTARAKVAKANANSSRKTSLNNKIAELQDQTSDYHENPFLKLSKTTKKEKQDTKSATFIAKLAGANLSGGISKSALRRRKRKAKEQLKPKMDELLSTLEESDSTIKVISKNPTSYIDSSKVNLNKPNAAKKTGHRKILTQEHQNFQQVLKNPQFRSSPFSALKDAIKSNMN